MQSYPEYLWDKFLKEREDIENVLGARRDGAVSSHGGMDVNNGGLDVSVVSSGDLLRRF